MDSGYSCKVESMGSVGKLHVESGKEALRTTPRFCPQQMIVSITVLGKIGVRTILFLFHYLVGGDGSRV